MQKNHNNAPSNVSQIKAHYINLFHCSQFVKCAFKDM